MKKEKSLVVFQDKTIRRKWYKDEWYFSVVNIIEVLTESVNPTDYLKKLRKRDIELGNYLGTNCPHIEMLTKTDKKRLTLAGNTKNIFRIIQSIPSKKAEPFKQWLAKVGYERIQEIENPELAQNRAREYYRLKGYPDSWIERRLRGIAIRQELTDEWKQRGVQEKKEFAILTNEISKATFDVSIKDHKKIKDLDPKFKNQNLRDHMTNLELVFNMLGEASTTEIAKSKNSQGFDENKISAKKGGKIAGNARKNLELETNQKVVSKKNYLGLRKKKLKIIK